MLWLLNGDYTGGLSPLNPNLKVGRTVPPKGQSAELHTHHLFAPFSLCKILEKFSANPLDKFCDVCYNRQVAWKCADIAQSVEHLIGNEEVISSNLIISSISESVPIGTDSV